MLAHKSSAVASRAAAARPALPSRACPLRPAQPQQRNVSARAIDDTNLALNVLASSLCISIPAAVTTITAVDREKEIERIQTVEGALPLVAALGADAVAHSIPGLNILFNLLTEPLGAATGVAYLMSLVLSSPAVDPTTLAPEGTVLNAKTAADSRKAIRVPFTRIIPTAIKVVDTSNDGASGAGWTIGESGLPKLPLNSVLIVLGVGGLIVELLAHAPVLSFFFPRVLQTAFWLAAAGYVLDKRE